MRGAMNFWRGIVASAMAALSLMFGAAAAESAVSRAPNVLMLVTDDLNDWLGCMGNTQATTPNIDRLAARGMVFENAFTAGAYCTPSRNAVMSGLGPWTSGCYTEQPGSYALPNHMWMQKAFKDAGYATLGTGKVYHHMPGYLIYDGYDAYYFPVREDVRGGGYNAWPENGSRPQSGVIGQTVYDNFDALPIPDENEGLMGDTMIVDWTLEQLKKQSPDRPFFISLGLYTPHKPNYAPQKYFDMYPLDTIKLPEGAKEGDIDDLPESAAGWVNGRIKHTHSKLLKVEDGIKRAIQGYHACVSYADAQLGRVLAALDRSPFKDNTIVVLWSDNGYHQSEKQMWAKHTLWERTLNVPMIWAGPGIPQGKVYTSATSLLDIYPTLNAMCDLKAQVSFDGRDLGYAFENPGKPLDRDIVAAKGDGRSFAVLNTDWHYISYDFGKGEELYNAARDPHEWHNLAEKPEFKGKLKSMRAKLPANPAGQDLVREELVLKLDGANYRWVKKNPKELSRTLDKLPAWKRKKYDDFVHTRTLHAERSTKQRTHAADIDGRGLQKSRERMQRAPEER